MEEIAISGWDEFRDRVRASPTDCPVYWRGSPNPAVPLASTFERRFQAQFGRDRPPDEAVYRRIRDAYLRVFMHAAAGLRGANPASLNEEQWWALGRHHGLVTPILDWTEKPYIAAFFALSRHRSRSDSEARQGAEHGGAVAVYRLLHTDTLEGDGLKVVRPVIEELGRMHGQRGLFTWLDSVRFLDLESFLEHTGRGHLLTRFLITGDALTQGLWDLDEHGIDYRTLYPDLYGAAMHSNAQLDWKEPQDVSGGR